MINVMISEELGEEYIVQRKGAGGGDCQWQQCGRAGGGRGGSFSSS